MGRPSQGIDKALIKAGFAELAEKGVRGLSVRSVCSRAGVSLRMLNYYFESKDNFIRLILATSYEEFLAAVTEASRVPGLAVERIRSIVKTCSRYMVENRAISRSLWMDAHAGEPLVLEAVAKYSPAHALMILDLIGEAQANGELRDDMQPGQIFMAVMPAVFSFNLFTDNLLPLARHVLPQKYHPVIDDPMRAAMNNFDCVIEGFKATPRPGTSRPAGSGPPKNRKLPRRKARKTG